MDKEVETLFQTEDCEHKQKLWQRDQISELKAVQSHWHHAQAAGLNCQSQKQLYFFQSSS